MTLTDLASASAPKNFRDQRRDRILQTAKDVFFELGYANASMSQIAARLGGSKATLYAYFGSKEELFSAIISDQCSAIQDTLSASVDNSSDPAEVLRHFAKQLLGLLLSDWGNRVMQLVISESPRDAQISNILYESGPGRGHQILVAYLEQAHEQGKLYAPDAHEAAWNFAALCKGSDLRLKRMMNMIPMPSEAEIDREVEAFVGMFMRAYAPKTP